ncbi:MAG: DUF305 domain-containing protein [Pyrinomonadaceae bacterium]
MKPIPTMIVALAVALAGAACQNRSNENAAAHSNSAAVNNADSADHSGHDMSNMKGHDMSKMADAVTAPGAAEQPYDLQFIDSMIHHHDGAIEMANMVIGKTRRQELKQFAQKIIDDQKKEIEQMRRWRDEWFAGKPSALNMELPGMAGGMAMMTSSHIRDMDSMEPDHFDIHFLNMMTQHHEGAVEMSKDALKKASRPEIKKLADDIIRAQTGEIEMMAKWKAQWKGEEKK